MGIFFNENGIFNLDEIVMEMPSFKKIMEDGAVTDCELSYQADRVSTLLQKVEESCTDEQAKLVRELLAEMSVLFSVYHYTELQTIR